MHKESFLGKISRLWSRVVSLLTTWKWFGAHTDMATVSDIQNLFLEKLVEGTGINKAAYPQARVFLTEPEYNLLAHDIRVLQTYVFNREIELALIDCSGITYLLITGLDNTLTHAYLTAIDNRTELSFAMLAHCTISRKVEVSEEILLENVFVAPDTDRIEWETVEPYFPKIQTFEVNYTLGATVEAQQALLRVMTLNGLCMNPGVLVLPFDGATLQCYLDVANSGNDEIPLDNVIRSLGSNYWKFCYIDMYRCIERLLLVGWVHNYKTTLSSGLAPNTLYSEITGKFKIAHHEWENIEYLFSLLPAGIKSMLDGVRNGESYHKFIYELRNQLVHYQKDEAVINAISKDDWNVIIQFMLVATLYLYRQLDGFIKQLPSL